MRCECCVVEQQPSCCASGLVAGLRFVQAVSPLKSKLPAFMLIAQALRSVRLSIYGHGAIVKGFDSGRADFVWALLKQGLTQGTELDQEHLCAGSPCLSILFQNSNTIAREVGQVVSLTLQARLAQHRERSCNGQRTVEASFSDA